MINSLIYYCWKNWIYNNNNNNNIKYVLSWQMFTKLYGIQLSYRPNIMLLIGLNFIPYVKLFLCISSAVGRIIYLLIPLAPMCCMLWYSLTNINLIFYTMDCVYVKIVFVLLNIMFFFHIVVELVVLINVVDFLSLGWWHLLLNFYQYLEIMVPF